MNERIRKLAEQAMVEAEHEFGGKYLAFSKEKFAELIVRECIEINKQELSFNAFERLMNKYKEHFGVEE